MSTRALLLAAVAGLGLLAAVSGAVLALRGSDAAAVRGVVLGAGAGAVGIALEAALLVRALPRPRGTALRIVIAGFLVRLAFLAGGALALRASGLADPASFALSFVGGFFAGIPAVAVAATTAARPSGSVGR